MSKQPMPMIMSVAEIKNAMLNPDLIKYLHDINISNQWGEINGRQLILDVYKLCEKHEELLAELEACKNNKI